MSIFKYTYTENNAQLIKKMTSQPQILFCKTLLKKAEEFYLMSKSLIIKVAKKALN